MTSHTPGPWIFQEYAQDAATIANMKAHGMTPSLSLTNDGAAFVMAKDADGDGVRIALIDAQSRFKKGQGWNHPCPERAANARLIAAAPDLLAALKALATDLCPETLAQARTAIAKAEGQGQ